MPVSVFLFSLLCAERKITESERDTCGAFRSQDETSARGVFAVDIVGVRCLRRTGCVSRITRAIAKASDFKEFFSLDEVAAGAGRMLKDRQRFDDRCLDLVLSLSLQCFSG